MKNVALPVIGLLFAVSYAGAEVIDSVMYNPARLGQYEKLKVSDKASFKGGVKANTLTLQSAGTVTVNNAGDYQVSNADVKGSVNMPSTHFVAPSIKTQGGTARFVQTGETSSIDTINSVLPRLKANILKMNAVTVNGGSTSDYDGDNIKGLRLGGNDIPAPSVNCSGLNWFARVDRNSGQTYQVLGLGACEGGEPEKKEYYGPDIYAEQFTSDTCPDGDEEVRSQTRFSCEDNPSYKGQCVDLFQSRFYFNYQDTYATTDTCDRNSSTKFYKTMSQAEKYHKFSCVDVYKEGSSYDSGARQGSWGCSGGRRGGYIIWDGINGPDSSALLSGSSSTQMVIVGGMRIEGNYSTYTGLDVNSSAESICAACKGSCQSVLLSTERADCEQGVGSDTVLRRYFKYRSVSCNSAKARKVTYKRSIGYRKVDCSGAGNVQGTAPEDKGA